MEKVPREEFMTPETKNYAYLDRPIPLEEGQTISAPHMVAIICEKLALKKGMQVLEIGTGFGYNAAVVSEIIGSQGTCLHNRENRKTQKYCRTESKTYRLL
jgi:protein-L-isoaspartate(D-aspartate) O-methyltransferase